MQNLDESIFSLRVSCETGTYSASVNIAENLKDLFEEIARQTLVQTAGTFRDEIVQIATTFGSFEDNDQLLVVNEVLEHMNNIFHFGDTPQEKDFQWNFAFGLK